MKTRAPRRWPPTGLVAPVVAAVLAGACADEGPAPMGVHGTVSDVDSGEPVLGARLLLVDPVDLAPASSYAETDGRGRYELAAEAAGDYAVFVFHGSFVVFDRSAPGVRVEAGRMSTHDVRLIDSELSASRYRIAGRVRDAVTGRPLAGAYVESQPLALQGVDVISPFLGINWPYWALTDAGGGFSVEALVATDQGGRPYGLFPLTATRDGYAPASLVGEGRDFPPYMQALLPLPADSVLAVVIHLSPRDASPPGAVRGRVLDLAGGTPVAGLRVALSALHAASPDTLRGAPAPAPVPGRVTATDEDGRFRIDGLDPGAYVPAVAYEVGDGYCGDPGFPGDYEVPVATIVAGDTAAVDVGDLLVRRAVRPESPAAGIMTGVRAELRWEAFPAGEGYAVAGYQLSYGEGYYMQRVPARLTGTSWTIGVTPGAHVRWHVNVLGAVGADQDTVSIGEFESVATFTVAP